MLEARQDALEGEDEPTLDERLEELRQRMNDPEADQEEIRRLVRQTLPGDAARIERLARPGADRDFYAEHMRAGQDLLAEGQWFLAEERFTSAIAMRPNDPIAAIGRIHAQLGAALFRSAGENLKELFRDSPEMIATKFDASLLPRGDRLDFIRVQLADRSRGDTDFARTCALLLAYLGRQYDNDRDIRAGFADIDRINDARADEPDPVYDAARAAWLPQDGQ